MQLGLAAAGAGASSALGLPSLALADPAPVSPTLLTESRALAFHNLNTGEVLQATYWQKGAYAPDVLAQVNKLLRDRRTGDVHAIDTRLLDLLHALNGKLGARAPFQVICGYRSPATNAMRHAESSQVAAHSLHMVGMAIDIRIDGTPLGDLHNAAMDLRGGGVGLYPQSNFVHVDVGPVRHWSGT